MRFFMLLATAALVACGSGHEKAPEKSDAAAIGNEAPSVALNETPPTSTSAPPEILNVTMPDFAPQYPGSIITAVNKSQSDDGTHEVTLRTQDDAAKIVDFYREKFTAAGLRKTSEFLSGGTGMMSAVGKGRKASIAIAKEDDHRAVIVTFSGD